MPPSVRLAVSVALICLGSTVLGRAGTSRTQATPAAPQDFPDGPNRALVVRICRDCHPVSQVVRRHETRARWSFLVDQMVKEGAEIKDEEFDKIVSYLTITLGKKIRINEAPVKDIAEAFDIDEPIAAAIVKYRTEKGPFKEWKDLLNVPGIDPQRVEEQKGNLDFGSATRLR